MKRYASLLLTGLLSLMIGACQTLPRTPALYFGQTPPGETPVVFAPDIISLDGRFEQFLLYSAHGRELIYGVTNEDWSAFSLHLLRIEDGRWSDVGAPSFLGRGPSAFTAALSPDGRTAFFTAAWPTYPPSDIWMSELSEDGWTDPVKLLAPVSSEADEFEVAISESGTLYFSSKRDGGEGDLDIYRAPLVDGGYPEVENLGPPVNTSSGDDLPWIAPDESYLIFASDRAGGFGNRDLYITFASDDGWTEPKNLGAPINSEKWEIYPSISPDGKYLFFTRRTSWQPGEDDDSDIYWVSADFIERLREE